MYFSDMQNIENINPKIYSDELNILECPLPCRFKELDYIEGVDLLEKVNLDNLPKKLSSLEINKNKDFTSLNHKVEVIKNFSVKGGVTSLKGIENFYLCSSCFCFIVFDKKFKDKKLIKPFAEKGCTFSILCSDSIYLKLLKLLPEDIVEKEQKSWHYPLKKLLGENQRKALSRMMTKYFTKTDSEILLDSY